MPRMSKLDRMYAAEEALGDAESLDAQSAMADLTQAWEAAGEARQEAAEAFAEAGGYHEDREWESRDGALDSAANALERLGEAVDTLEQDAQAALEMVLGI